MQEKRSSHKAMDSVLGWFYAVYQWKIEAEKDEAFREFVAYTEDETRHAHCANEGEHCHEAKTVETATA